jgi:hypothetical protein
MSKMNAIRVQDAFIGFRHKVFSLCSPSGTLAPQTSNQGEYFEKLLSGATQIRVSRGELGSASLSKNAKPQAYYCCSSFHC